LRPQKYWKIEVADGLESIFCETYLFSRFGPKQIVEILRRLACGGLDHDEIIAASGSPKKAGYRPLLEIRTMSSMMGNAKRYTISVGESYHCTASIWEEDEIKKKADK
jgi:hypothetical protein